MNKDSRFYENKEYIFLIGIIFIILIFISEINEKDSEKYNKILMEKNKSDKTIKELVDKIDKRHKELEKMELELLELKNKEKEKITNKFSEIKNEEKKEKYIKILNNNKINKSIIEKNTHRVVIPKKVDINNEKFINIKDIDLSKIKSYHLVWPVESRKVIEKFGEKITSLSNNQEYNRGIKIDVKNDELVNSGIDGIVTFSGEKGSYGNLVEIQREDGLKVRYSNLKKIEVVKNEIVFIGDKIGEVVENGMLNYEVLIEGIPVDPLKFKYD